MKNSKKIGVRKYHKSEQPRLRWTPHLHDYFVEAVERLGGKEKATPKRILSMMHVKGLRIAHIKSHLQMYRNMKLGHTILAPMYDQLLEQNAQFNDLPNCSNCKISRNLNQEHQPLYNRDSQTSETDHYDLNQEPESSECFLSDMSNEEGNSRTTKFLDLPLSLSTPLIPMVHNSDQDRMHFSSPSTTDNHVVDSSSIQSHGSNYINLDLTI